MTRRLWVSWLAVLTLSGTGILLSFRAASTARQRADLEVARFSSIAEQARTLNRLRAVKPSWTNAGVSEGGLAASISAALASTGLAASVLSSLSPEGTTASGVGMGSQKSWRQRASLTLSPITLPQLGAFLDRNRPRKLPVRCRPVTGCRTTPPNRPGH
jgi:hypothetical protein